MRLLLILVFLSNLTFGVDSIDLDTIDDFERDMLGNIQEKYLTGFTENNLKFLNTWNADGYDITIVFNKNHTYHSSIDNLKGTWKIDDDKVIITHKFKKSKLELTFKNKFGLILVIKIEGKEDQEITFGRNFESIKKEVVLE